MAILILGLVLFLGIHSVSILSLPRRDRMAARLGANGWRALYSLVAIAGFVLIVWGYSLARNVSVLYVPPFWLRHVTLVLMLPVFPLLLAAYLPGRIKAATQHPMLLAVKLWALAHLLANGALADVLLFGSLLVWAGVDRASAKRRGQQPAITAAPSKLNDPIAIVAGLAIYALLVLGAHRWLFGVPAAMV